MRGLAKTEPSCTSENVFAVLAAFFCGVFVVLRWLHFYFSLRAADSTGFDEIASLVHGKKSQSWPQGVKMFMIKILHGRRYVSVVVLVGFYFVYLIYRRKKNCST